jgi:hypothetical protein
MPLAALPLTDLAKRLARTQSQVDRLRNQYESRLEVLRRRRANLQSQLDKVEAEIQRAQGQESAVAPAAAPVAAPARGRRGKIGLRDWILKMIQEAGRPLTAGFLAEEIRRRKIPTKSKDIPRLVQTRLFEMRRTGILTHIKGRPGYTLVNPNGRPAPAAAQLKPAAKPSIAARRKKQPALSHLLRTFLAKSKSPLPGPELARRALAAGYKSQSENFNAVVSVALSNMDDAVHVAGQGYRLRKR